MQDNHGNVTIVSAVNQLVTKFIVIINNIGTVVDLIKETKPADVWKRITSPSTYTDMEYATQWLIPALSMSIVSSTVINLVTSLLSFLSNARYGVLIAIGGLIASLFAMILPIIVGTAFVYFMNINSKRWSGTAYKIILILLSIACVLLPLCVIGEVVYTITHLSMLISNLLNLMYMLIYTAMCILSINVMINSSESEDQTIGVRPEMDNDSQYDGDMFDMGGNIQKDRVSKPIQPVNKPIQPVNRPVQPMNRPVQPKQNNMDDGFDDILG